MKPSRRGLKLLLWPEVKRKKTHRVWILERAELLGGKEQGKERQLFL